MAVSKEYTIYCLSLSKGWVNTTIKTDFKDIEKIEARPNDTVLEIKFTTEFPYFNEGFKDEKIIFGNEADTNVKEAKIKFGNRPKYPYL